MGLFDFETSRKKMVEDQLIKRGIHDLQVIKAMIKIPREVFLDASLKEKAYEDGPLGIGFQQTISQPYMVAKITECIEPTPKKRVLEIGAGCGYQMAVLAEICAHVTGYERVAPLACRAKTTLEGLGYKNTKIVIGDGTHEQDEKYDAIIISAAAPTIPISLFKSLENSGILTVPVGLKKKQLLKVFQKDKIEDKISVRDELNCVFVPLLGELGWE